MALEAGVWAFVRSKPSNHLSARSVIDLVGFRTKEHAVHNGRHVARHTATGFRAGSMPRVRFRLPAVAGMTLGTHAVGICCKSQGFWIVRGIFAMDIVAMAAIDLTLLKAG